MAKSSLDVFLSLHGQRKFSKELLAAGNELEAMGLKGAKSMERFARTSDKVKTFGRSWTRNISLPVAGLGVIAGKTAMDFDRSMSLIATQAGGSAREVKGLQKSVLGMHNQFTPLERAKGLFFIESAGLRGSKAMKALAASANLATVENSDLEHTVFGMVGAMNAFGKEGRHFNRMAAIMNSAVGHGHMHGEEFVGALSTGLPGAAKSFGVSFKGMSSAISFFTRMGEPAQQVATRLRQTITHLATNATTKGAEALESIGISTERMGASIRKTGRLGPVIKELAEHLNAVGKTKSDQVLTEAFGGGRFGTQIREATQRWQLLLKTEHEVGKFATSKRFNLASKIANEQPAVKLKETWAELSAVLVNLGNVVLPAAVPGLQRLTGVVSGVGHAFGAMSPEMQAGIGGFLLLTGPIAHGLGYFAGGVGKALILTSKLAKASSVFQSVLSANVMTEQSGFRGAFGAASKQLGLSGALQTAKGFAYALGPAVAAYGIGNIVTSATSNDWGDAGLEAAGAFAGGLIGSFGGPVGAMFGVGIGSLAGELASNLIGSDKKIETAQQKFERQAKRTKGALEAQKKAGEALAHSGSAIVAAHHRQKAASQEVRTAEHALDVIRQEKGPNSEAAIRAEIHLAKAGERRLGVTRKLHNLERKKGESLELFKESNAYAILQERKRLSELKERVAESRSRRKALKAQGVTGARLAKADEALIERRKALWGAKSDLVHSYQEADKVAGSSWADFVRHANTKALELGHGLKGASEKVEGLERALKRLHETEGEAVGTLKKGLVEEATERALGQARREERALGHSPKGHPAPHAGPHAHHHQGVRRHRSNPSATQSLVLPPPRPSRVREGSLSHVIEIHVVNENTLNLDGKKVAENTTHQSRKAANRE